MTIGFPTERCPFCQPDVLSDSDTLKYTAMKYGVNLGNERKEIRRGLDLIENCKTKFLEISTQSSFYQTKSRRVKR